MSEIVERVDEMVDRVATALAIADYRADYKSLARAAITAMRQPTESMRKAGALYLGTADIHFAWQAMIDAALGEPASEGGEG